MGLEREVFHLKGPEPLRETIQKRYVEDDLDKNDDIKKEERKKILIEARR